MSPLSTTWKSNACWFARRKWRATSRSGALDAGITGHDWVVETGAAVEELAELVYAKQRLARVRWVLAVPEDSPMHDPRDLAGKIIATEVVNITENYLARHGVKARVEFSWGATEVKVPATR